MRICEISLLLLSACSLFLLFTKPPKAVWHAVAGGMLTLCVLHGVFEGFRYQLLFVYGFVSLFVIYAVVKTTDQFAQVRTPKLLKLVAVSLAVLLLAFSGLLAYALPVFNLPKPTGSYAVGVTYLPLRDETRTDPFLAGSTQPRELMVKVYYPAQPDPTKAFLPYFHQSRTLLRLFAGFYGMPAFFFDHLALVKTHAKEELLISDQQPAYPIVLFSHGAGTTLEVETAQSEDLASHGYMVVAIDHPYVSAATIFPDHVVSQKEATTNFDVVEPAVIITQIMADDAKFVIDTLGEWNAGTLASPFQGKLQLDQIGIIGHSVGGAVAYNLAINDSRVKAAINLDGTVYVRPKAEGNAMAPFLMLANDRYHSQAIMTRKNLMADPDGVPAEEADFLFSLYGGEATYREAYDQAQQNLFGLIDVLAVSGNLFTIEGSDHMKFSDIGLFIGLQPLRTLIGIGGELDPATCLEITQALTVAFFDQHLKGETTTSFNALLQAYPALKQLPLP